MLLDPMIPASERQRIMRGSHEQARQTLEALVALRSDLFGSDSKPNLVATFPAHVVVESNEKLFTVKYAVDDKGAFKLDTTAVPVFVERIAKKQHIESVMYGVVDALLTDQLDTAVDLAKQLVPRLGEAKELLAYADVPTRVTVLLDRPCPWKDVVAENTETGTPRFGKLYDGSMRSDEISGYDELVRTEFGTQNDELEKLWVAVGSLEDVIKLMPDTNASAKFVNLVEDYRRDLAEVRDVLQDVEHQVKDTAVLGKVSDLLAASLPKYRALCSHVQLSITH